MAARQATAPKAPEVTEPEAPEVTEPEAPEVTVIVREQIGGLRNGQPWPAVGERFTLPRDEAEAYQRLGYITE